MAPVNLHPPQTYARLFRPWDSTTSDEDSNSDSLSIVKQESAAFRVFPDRNNIYDETAPCSYASDSMTGYGFNHTGIPNIVDLYQYSNGLRVPPSNFSVDPFSANLMEHEYARVMAEDAHLRALNSRKQRPKKFKCPHCDVAFSNNGQLKGHIRIHTGERPFKCDVETCGKTFTRNEELTRHKRIHTGLRPYACPTCAKKFGRRDHLKKHMKTHLPQDRHLGSAILVPMYPFLYGY